MVMENRNICIMRLNDIPFTYLVQLYNMGLRFRDNTFYLGRVPQML